MVEFKRDEFIKPETTVEGLGKLRAVFKNDGTVTAGNASGEILHLTFMGSVCTPCNIKRRPG